MSRRTRTQIIGGTQLLIILAMMVVFGFFLRGLLGAIFTLLIFFGTILIVSQYLIPLYGLAGRTAAFSALLSFLFRIRMPLTLVEEGRIKPNPSDTTAITAGPRILDVKQDSAAVTESPRGPTVYGPGVYAITDRREKPKYAVDLRPQSRTDQTDAMTSDGVQITLPFTVDFQLDPQGASPSPNQPFPFSPNAVIQATYESTQIAPQGPTVWYERVTTIVSEALRDQVNTQRLIDLITPSATAPNPRQTLGQQALAASQLAALRLGAKLNTVSVGPFTIPDENVRRDFDRWRTKSWDKDVQFEETTGMVVRIQDVTNAMRSLNLNPQTIRDVLVMLFTPPGKTSK